MASLVVVTVVAGMSPVAADPPAPGDATLTVDLSVGSQPVDYVQVGLCTDPTDAANCFFEDVVADGLGTASATFDPVAPGNYTLGVIASWSGDPYHRDFHTYEIGPANLVSGSQTVLSTPPTGGRLSGTVFGSDANPVDGGIVSFQPDPQPSWPWSIFQLVGLPSVSIHPDGSFTTPPFPAGDYLVHVAPGGPGRGAAVQGSVTIVAGATTTINPPLAAGGRIAGHVMDGVSPIEGALVSVFSNSDEAGSSVTGLTDATGAYFVGDVLPGSGYSVMVSKPGFATQRVDGIAVVADATTDDVDFTLATGLVLSGTVRDAEGDEIPYANVGVNSASGGFGTSVVADEFGYYEVTDLAADFYDISAYLPPEFIPTLISGFELTASSALDLTLERGGSIRGVVYDASGAPLEGAFVSANGPGFDSTNSDFDGSYLLDGLAPGTYTVTAQAPFPGVGYDVTETVVVVGGQETDQDLHLLLGGGLEVTVVNGSGEGIADASVSVSDITGPVFTDSTDGDGFIAFPDVRPGSVTVWVFPPPGSPYDATNRIVSVSSGTTTAITITLPDFTGVSGTVTRTEPIPTGVIGAVIACPAPLDPVTSFTNCLTPPPPLLGVSGGPYAMPLTPGVPYNVAAIYTSGLTPPFTVVASSLVASVTVSSGEVVTCNFATGPGADASCSVAPPPTPGTVVLTVDEPNGFPYYPGFCAAPGLPVLGSQNCSDGRPATILFGVPGGSTQTVSLPPGTYNAGMARLEPPPVGLVGGPSGSVTVVSGQTTFCSFTVAGGPDCTVDDGDGVDEPADYDGNHDGEDDDAQANVTSFVPDGGADPVTLVTTGDALTDVTTEPVPGSPAPPAGADFPIGLLGFTVQLADGASSADVEIWLPSGTDVDSYFKLLGGSWLEVPAADVDVSTAVTGETVVTLTLHDNDVFDTNGDAGVIGDPGGPASVDDVAPVITCPTPRPRFLLNQAGATLTAAVTDADSGPVSPTVTVAVPTSGLVGLRTVDVAASDNAGNSASGSCEYELGYQFTGFSSPIDNLPKLNSSKAGQAIPVKWRITDANGVGISDPASFRSVTSTGGVNCSTSSVDAIEDYTGNSGLQYLGNGNWQFNWKTPKSYAGQCRRMKLNLADGTVDRVADFKFK
jgi:hypothetical protein